MEHQGYNGNLIGNENHYQTCQNKELEEELGLNWHDFGARRFQSDIARWTTLDPLAEKFYSWSPYNGMNNNPVMFVDPTGMASESTDIEFETSDVDVMVNVGYGRKMASSQFGGAMSFSGGTPVLNSSGEEKLKNISNEAGDGDKPIGEDYKGKTQTAPATPMLINGKPNINAYNCHSYAWCNSLGDPKDPANQNLVKYGITRWDNDPTNNTGDYFPLTFNNPNQIGDRVIYYAWNSQSAKVMPTHSAIVTKVDQYGNTVQVESKWGEAARYRHHPRDIPSIYGATTPTFIAPDGNIYASRIYFRKKS